MAIKEFFIYNNKSDLSLYGIAKLKNLL